MSKLYGPWPADHETAVALGVRHYFTGQPCKRGHVGLRLTRTRNCLVCKREAERASSLERLRAHSSSETDEQRLAKQRRFRDAHRDKINAKKRETREFERYMRNMEAGQ